MLFVLHLTNKIAFTFCNCCLIASFCLNSWALFLWILSCSILAKIFWLLASIRALWAPNPFCFWSRLKRLERTLARALCLALFNSDLLLFSIEATNLKSRKPFVKLIEIFVNSEKPYFAYQMHCFAVHLRMVFHFSEMSVYIFGNFEKNAKL